MRLKNPEQNRLTSNQFKKANHVYIYIRTVQIEYINSYILYHNNHTVWIIFYNITVTFVNIYLQNQIINKTNRMNKEGNHFKYIQPSTVHNDIKISR